MLYVILNPKAGSGKGAAAKETVARVLKEKNAAYTICETEYAGHAVELAREISKKSDCEGIIAAGGDGTFFEVLNGMDTAVPLGLVPCGTGNDFAAGIGMEKDVRKAVAAIIEQGSAPIDYIAVGEKRCLNIAGAGFDIDVLNKEKSYRKLFKGKMSYYAALLVTLFFYKFKKITLVVDDGRTIETDFFLFTAANGRFFGGGMPIAMNAEYDDGLIDVVLIRRMPKIAMPRLLLKFARGTLETETKYVETFRCRKIRCEIEGSRFMQLDGEILELLPAEIELKHGKITMLGRESGVKAGK